MPIFQKAAVVLRRMRSGLYCVPPVTGHEQFIVLGPWLKFCHDAGGFHQAREHHADGNRAALASGPHQLACRFAGGWRRRAPSSYYYELAANRKLW